MAHQYKTSKPLAIRTSPFTPHLSSDPEGYVYQCRGTPNSLHHTENNERDLIELSFGAILSGKSSVGAGRQVRPYTCTCFGRTADLLISQTCLSTDRSRIVSSPLQPYQSTPVNSINAPLVCSEEVLPPDITKTDGDSDTQCSILDPAVVQKYHEAIFDLRSRIEQRCNHIKEEEQKVQTLQEELYFMELMVGPAEPPAHLQIKNIFDDPIASKWSLEHQPDSPVGKTLVESGPAASSHSSKTATMSSVSQEHLNPKCEKSEDVPMTDLMLEIDPHENDLSSPAPKKRKRCSKSSGTKQARTKGNLSCNDLSTDAENSSVPEIRIKRAWNAVLTMLPTTHHALTTMTDLQAHLGPFHGNAAACSGARQVSPTRNSPTCSIT